MWQVYFLKSYKAKWYYIGSTNNLERRLKEHNTGKVLSTKTHKPLRVVYTKDFDSEKDARIYEKRLEKNRIEKESIIRHIEQ